MSSRNIIILKNKIQKFNKIISVSGDKSISIRWVLLSSLSSGISRAKNLLMSEDVLAAIKLIKKLGIRVKVNKNECKIYGMDLTDISIKNLTINAENSGL